MRPVLVMALAILGCASGTGGSSAKNDAGTPVSCGANELASSAPNCGGEPAAAPSTFTCGDTTLTITGFDDGLVRIVDSRAGVTPTPRAWAIEQLPNPVELSSGRGCEGRVRLCTGAWAIELDPGTCRITRASDAQGHAALEDATSTHEPGKTHFTRHLDDGERLSGLGSHTGSIELRGRRRTLWNTDAYDATQGGFAPAADPLYLSLPLLLSSRNGSFSGHFVNETRRMDYDLGAAKSTELRIDAASDALEHWLVAGPDAREVLRRYTALTGRAPLPPRWALGFHQSRWGYATAARVLEIAGELRRRDFPADALWLDIQHMRGFRSFTFDPDAFGDPDALTGALASQGFHTVAIVDPGLKVDPAWDVYAQGLSQGHFLGSGATPFEGTVWPGLASFPDFSAARTRDWWSGLVPRLTDHGIDGVWIDMNEPATFDAATKNTVPNELAIDGDGAASTMAELHNAFGLLEAKATREGLTGAHPDRRPFVLSRAGFSGLQRFAAVWTGDAPSTWATLRQTPAMLMTLGISGLGFAGSDVGGYSGGATPELFARWVQVGSISPFLRAHVTQNVNDQEPWAFGPEVEVIAREAIRERYRLMPYLYDLFSQLAETGAPPLRPLFFESADASVAGIDDQAMLGPWMLYAPVLDPGTKSRRVVLPPGRWLDERSNRLYTGPGAIEVGVTLAALPTYVREGAIVPRAPLKRFTGETGDDTLELDTFPGTAPTSFTHRDDPGDGPESNASQITYTLIRNNAGAVLSASARSGPFTPPARKLVIRMRRVDREPSSVMLGNVALRKLADEASVRSGPGWAWDANDRSLFISLADQDAFELRALFGPELTDAPTVSKHFRVALPPGTPPDAVIHVATSLNGWAHVPLARLSDTVAEGRLDLPRGEWFEYKYTRGGWDTVEKWPGCVEASNRYELADARHDAVDTVAAWADHCR